jgi:hypothetical protein
LNVGQLLFSAATVDAAANTRRTHFHAIVTQRRQRSPQCDDSQHSGARYFLAQPAEFAKRKRGLVHWWSAMLPSRGIYP